MHRDPTEEEALLNEKILTARDRCYAQIEEAINELAAELDQDDNYPAGPSRRRAVTWVLGVHYTDLLGNYGDATQCLAPPSLPDYAAEGLIEYLDVHERPGTHYIWIAGDEDFEDDDYID